MGYNPITSRQMNDNTWRYKVPVARDLPAEFRVEVSNFTENAEPSSRSPSDDPHHRSSHRRLLSSRATGEPPLLAASAVLSALRECVMAFGDRSNFVELPVPCTVEAVREECA